MRDSLYFNPGQLIQNVTLRAQVELINRHLDLDTERATGYQKIGTEAYKPEEDGKAELKGRS